LDLETCVRISARDSTTLLVEEANFVSGQAHFVVTFVSAAAGWYLLAVLLNLLAIILIPTWVSL
jgi:hypothetical protein